MYDCDNLLRCALAAGVPAGSCHQGKPLLCIAAQLGSLRPMLTLLDNGADPNAGDRHFSHTALIAAIIQRRPECCSALVDVSDLSLTNRIGDNALHVCVNNASLECFELLLPRVGDVDARTVPGVDEHGTPLAQASGMTALMFACARGQPTW